MPTEKSIVMSLSLLFLLTSCTSQQNPSEKMAEEERQTLMIQKDPKEENRKIMEENVETITGSNIPMPSNPKESSDPYLLMDQSKYDEKSNTITPDRMEKK